MIRKAALLLISLFIACAASTTEPEFEGVFFAAGLSGELVTLERQPFTVQTRIKAIGFGGVRTAAEINSKKSPVRFSSNDKNAFVVRSANPTIDPATLYMLQSFTVSKS